MMQTPVAGYFMTQEMIEELINQAVERCAERVEEILQTRSNERPLQISEFVEMYGICRQTIPNWEKDGIVKVVKLGARRYVKILNVNKLNDKVNRREICKSLNI